MKNLLLVFGVVALFGLTSCEKEYTCTCTLSDDAGVAPDVVTTTELTGKKKDVKESCEALAPVAVAGFTSTCDYVAK